MKRTGIALFICYFYIAGLIVAFSSYIKNDIQEFEQLKLSYAIDYASDAAIQALLDSKDLAMDYLDQDFMTLDPNLALDMFIDVFLYNYGLSIDETNRSHVKLNFIPAFTVATFDGYYLATPRLIKNDNNYPEEAIKNGDWDLVFSPKIPYIYEAGGACYALNMDGSYALKMTGAILSKHNGLPPNMTTQDDVRIEINKIISTDIAYTIDKLNETNPNWANSFYIPGTLTTYSGVNPIEGPSVLTLVQNVDLTTSEPIAAFSVAGSKLHKANMVAGYTKAGVKTYCYANKIDPTFVIENLFSNVREAALAGYFHDTDSMD